MQLALITARENTYHAPEMILIDHERAPGTGTVFAVPMLLSAAVKTAVFAMLENRAGRSAKAGILS